MAIESVMFYGDSKLAGEQSAEADWQRRGLYIGPQFSELDEVCKMDVMGMVWLLAQ